MNSKFTVVTIVLLTCLTFSIPSYGSGRLYPKAFEGIVSLYPVPLAGEKSTLTAELTAIGGDYENVTVHIQTPEGISLLGRSTFEENHFSSGSTRKYYTEIAVLKEGSYALQATVYYSLSDGRQKAEHFFTYLNAGKTSSEAGKGIPFQPEKQELMPRALPAPTAAGQTTGGIITISGYITYVDDNLKDEIPIRRVKVELLEEDKLFTYKTNSTYTDSNGFYIFENISNLDPEDAKGRDVKLRISFDNDVLNITDKNGSIYTLESATVFNVPDGQVNLDYFLDQYNQYRALGHIFDCIMDSYDFLKSTLGWSRNKITVKWPYGDWSRYTYSYYVIRGRIYDENIELPLGIEWERVTLLHEYGHAVMTALYGYNAFDLPQETFNESHSVYTVSDPGFAMKEGWAEFFEALVDDDAFNVVAYSNANVPNIETNEWWTGDIKGKGSNTKGEMVEGAVASILWDIVDSYRSHDETPGVDDEPATIALMDIWSVVQKDDPQSILEFWDLWLKGGNDNLQSVYSIFTDHGVEVIPPWDVNRDGVVNHVDLASIASQLGKSVSAAAPNNPDVNKDGEVSILDIIICARNIKP